MMASSRRRTGYRTCMITVMSLLMLSFQARAITLNFGNLDGTVVNFAGNSTFNFTSTNGYQFSISSVQGGVGDSVGLDGFVSPGGPFTIGPITITTNGILQSANVTGAGVLHIVDTLGSNLVGNVQWLNITTVGVGGILDLTGNAESSIIWMYPRHQQRLDRLGCRRLRIGRRDLPIHSGARPDIPRRCGRADVLLR